MMEKLRVGFFIAVLSIITVGMKSYSFAASWKSVGHNGFSVGKAYPSICVCNGTPYVTYSNVPGQDSTTAIVMKFNGAYWEKVGAGEISLGKVAGPLIFNYNGTPYVMYQDHADGTIKVAKFYGGHWVLAVKKGLRYNSLGWGHYYIYDGKPYMIYPDKDHFNKVTLMTYNGEEWIPVGSFGFSPGPAFEDSLYVDHGIPYVIYKDRIRTSAAVVMKYEGNSWADLNFPKINGGVRICVSNGAPYVIIDDGKKFTLMKYDGSTWINVGERVSHDDIFGSESLFTDEGDIYIAFIDKPYDAYPPHAFKLNVMKFNGSGWVSCGKLDLPYQTYPHMELYVQNGVPYLAFSDVNYDSKATVMKFE